MIRLGPTVTRAAVCPVDGADELGVEGKPGVLVLLMLLAVYEEFVVAHRRPLRQAILDAAQKDLSHRYFKT